jgi:predicted nuclease of predicted toxin-antitoxin system
MNLLVDEGVDKQIVDRLREEGYSVIYIAEMAPGISDDIVLEMANKEGSLLLQRIKTLDI